MENNWYPAEIPPPLNSSVVEIDCNNLSEQEIFFKAVTAAYNVMEDDAELRKSPVSFEKLRNDYKVRREFNAYTINLHNASDGLAGRLLKLGFKVI
jgi:erythronate-4-phosphate dehydrogenase